MGFGAGNRRCPLLAKDARNGAPRCFSTQTRNEAYFHYRDRRGISDGGSGDAGSAVAYSGGNPGEGPAHPARTGEGGDAPVGGRGGDWGLQEHQGSQGRSENAAAGYYPAGAGERAEAGVGGDASVWRLACAGNSSRPTLQEYCRGHAVGGAGEPDFWAARAHWD